MNEHLFAYGTLQHGFGVINALLEAYSTRLCRAEVKGTLYSVADLYPALTLEGEASVFGTIFSINPQQENRLFELLDMYEQVGRGLYARKQVFAKTENNEHVKAWAYIWRPETTGLKRIPSGDWLAYEGQSSIF